MRFDRVLHGRCFVCSDEVTGLQSDAVIHDPPWNIKTCRGVSNVEKNKGVLSVNFNFRYLKHFVY